MSLLQRVLAPLADIRREETVTALLMFAYSFLAMTAYNIIQPLTRSKLISSLGAVNVPWVIFGSGLVIGVLMLGYTRMVSVLPRRWALPITQAIMAGVMILFWALFRTRAEWVSVAVLFVGAPARRLAHQPVLDSRQRHLRPAPGQTAVRLHRRRRHARRHGRRRSHGRNHRDGWRQFAAPLERVCSHRLPHHRFHRPRPGTEGGRSGRRPSTRNAESASRARST